MSSLDFTLLLSPDNASRKAAEATFDAARQSHPQLVAAQLITTLNTSGDPATQELCAVLARRYLPAMFALTPLVFTEETRESVKTGLLSALSAGYAPSLRRKLCSTVGRLGAELLASNGWPQLNDFVQHACGSSWPTGGTTRIQKRARRRWQRARRASAAAPLRSPAPALAALRLEYSTCDEGSSASPSVKVAMAPAKSPAMKAALPAALSSPCTVAERACTSACEASERAMRGTTQQRFLLAHERFG